MTELCRIAKSSVPERIKRGRNLHTDKVNHGYTLYYDDLMNEDRDKEINMLEIGIFNGFSIFMWNDYFKKGNIYCIDNCEANCYGHLLCPIEVLDMLNKYSTRIKAESCCQKDREKLKGMYKDVEFDYIIDDGHHFQEDQQVSLGALFKNVKKGGTYIVEDITCMWGFQHGAWTGQKDGILDTVDTRVGGRALWVNKYKQIGKLKEEEVFNDTTWYVLQNFNKTGKFESPYLLEEEKKYLEENVESIEIIAAPMTIRENLVPPSFPGANQMLKEIIKLPLKDYKGTEGSRLKGGCIAIIKKKD